MACLMLDSFDHYALSDLTRKWTQYYENASLDPAVFAIASGQGRRSTNAFKVTRSSGSANLTSGGLSRVLTPSGTTAYTGFAFKSTGTVGWSSLFTPAGGGNSLLMSAVNGGVQDSRVNVLAAVRNSYYTHVALSINNNGTISAYRGNADSLSGGLVGQDRIAATLGTTAQALLMDQYYYIELKVLVHPSAGTVLVKVNGDVWLNLSGIDTQADGASSATAWQEIVVLGLRAGGGLPVSWYVDDLYIGDTDASDAFNQMIDLVGDLRIDYRNVFQDGTERDWIPLSGPDHFAMVDDNPPDLDTTYNSSVTVNDEDTFLKNAVPVVGAAVVALQPIYLARRTEGGNTSTAAVIRDAGANFTGSKEGSGTAEGNTTTYSYDWWTVTQRPSAAGTPLTQALVDAMEVGYKKVT